MGFVKKVYSILGIQLTLTSLFILVPLFNPNVRTWMAANWPILIAALVGQIVTSIALICCRGLSRRVPINYIMLAFFTVCEAYLVGFIASFYNPTIVLAAASATAGITIAISIYAMTTKSDFTIFGPMLLIVGFVFCIMSLFIFLVGQVLNMIFCGLAVILFSFYLLFDTQLIMGGKRYEIEIDDYILGAVILYSDIITIFLYLLSLMGGNNK